MREIKIGLTKLRRLYGDGRKLNEGVSTQQTALKSGIERLIQVLSKPDFLRKMEGHQAIATKQKERATEMAGIAQDMSDRAIEMRRPLHRWLITKC
jgi:hypothetical protein